MNDCNKCDERGMIADKKIKGAAYSCKCGKSNRLMEKRLKDVPIHELVAYLDARNGYKLFHD